MDPQLKQRLIGVTLAVALVVIFVPMLFEKSDDKGKLSNAGIPFIPDDVMEKPLELPKTAEDLAPKEEEEAKKAPAQASGYTIVPFNEEAQPKPKPASQPAAQATEVKKGEAVVGEEDDETGQPEPDKSVKKSVGENQATAPVKPVKSDASGAAVKKPVEAKPQKPAPANAAVKPPQPAADAGTPEEPDGEGDVVPTPEPVPAPPVKPKTPVKASEPAAKKSVAASQPPAAPSRPVVKTVKVSKPKPAAASIDEENEPARPAAAAKTEAPAAKPKPPRRPTEAAVKKPESDTPQPAKAVAPKPLVAAPAKPVPTQAPVKAVPKKPSTYVIQAGSFTDEAAAKSLVDKLKQSKFPASVQAVHGEHGSVYKVQVGAEHDRSHAEDTLKQIEGSTGINGIITERH